MKLFRTIALAGLVAGAFGCESFVEDLNIDPNEFTDISTALLVNHAVLNVASVQEAEPARIAGMWTDQFTGSDRQYITQDNYGVDDSDFDATWNELYRDGLAPARGAKAKAAAEGATGFEGIATIMEGFYAAEAALLFGDVPFSEADNATDFPDPAYDSQASVITGAIALLNTGGGKAGALSISGGNSVLTGGCTWAEMAKALEARYKLSMKDYPGALTAAEASFDEPDDEPSIIHSTVNFAENLFFQFEAEQRSDYLTFDGSFLSRVLSDTTDVSRTGPKTNDTNRRLFYQYTAGGFDRLNTNPGGLFAADRDYPVISYPEVQLIIAEAAQRTGANGKAITALNNARNYWDGLMGTDDYIDFEASDFADDAALLKAIMLEKFVSVFGLPTFYDIIRTDNLIGTDLDGRDEPVQRFIYPSVERSSNSSYPGLKTLDDPTPINM
ncbi:SusD/RagB family nutrient-binding outer membrane lipoprotein [Neolewinella persica]|uniref:SusD/RagB family nutrient-binding outer membrane lipoprotein n=1 Tax=Neolewinella persica TaxID=70998 RepID=UPI000364F218|nr:SusD/RagB family nutrient-binding outer membrane lipoprotein [Neolewinella persica]